jgi:hypothetical protein
MMDANEKFRWAERLKAQGWGYYRAAYTHGRQLWEHALTAFEQAEALFREVGTDAARAGLVGTLSGRATVLRSSGAPEAIRQALGLYEEEVALLRELGRRDDVPEALVNLALAHRDLMTVEPAETPGLARAVGVCREALDGAKRTGDEGVQALALSTLADLCLFIAGIDTPDLRERHLKEALAFYGQAEKLWEGRDEDGRALARMGMAEAYIALGRNLEGARDFLAEVHHYYAEYAGLPVKGPVRYQMAQVKELEARLLEAEGKPEDAAQAREEGRRNLDALGFRDD